MFVPPEKRHPGSSPWDSQPPKRGPTSRETTVLLWVISLLLLLTMLAPIGGSTVLDALWYVLRR